MRWLLIAIVALGCGKGPTAKEPAPGSGSAPPPDAAVVNVPPDAPPGPLDRDLPRLALRSLALYQALVAAFKTAGADCAAATKALAALRTEYADVTAANTKVLQEGRGRELKAALAKHDDKLEAAAKELVASQTLQKCTGDRAFTMAFDEVVAAPP